MTTIAELNNYHPRQKLLILAALSGFRAGDLVRLKTPVRTRSIYAQGNVDWDVYEPLNLTFEHLVNTRKMELRPSDPGRDFNHHLLHASDIALLTDIKFIVKKKNSQETVPPDMPIAKGNPEQLCEVFIWMTLMANEKEWCWWTTKSLHNVFRDQMKLWQDDNQH